MQINGWYQSVPAKGTAFAWAESRVDPDGVARDRTTESERTQYLQDVRAELAFAHHSLGRRVIDFGAGSGWFLGALGEGWVKHGIEIDESAVRLWPKDVVRLPHLSHAEKCVHDLVICHHVIEHCRSPELIIGGLYDTLRHGGHMIFATPDFDSPCARRFGPAYRMFHDPTHISLFSRASAERFLLDHWFAILDVRYPFPERYATAENFVRWNDARGVSPPWPGNWMTFYCRK